jgi:uncharacterized membrane protein
MRKISLPFQKIKYIALLNLMQILHLAIKEMIKKISFILLIILYAAAGINHFVHKGYYYPLIPPYFPSPELINTIAGVGELLAAVLLVFSKTKRFGVYLIIALLIAYIPAHIYMIQMGGCMSEQICIPKWAAWVRLIPFQFILMWWAWGLRK